MSEASSSAQEGAAGVAPAGGREARPEFTMEDYLECLALTPDFAQEVAALTHMDNQDLYRQVKLHIDTHKYFIEEKIPISISLQRATHSWCRNVWSPLVAAIEETKAEKIFPDLSRIELFLKISDHMYYLLEEKKRIEIYNRGGGMSDQERDRLASYVFIPFNQVVYSYISRYAQDPWRRFFARFRLTKVRTRPKRFL